MPSPFARSIRRRVDSRTWPTLPAAPSSSSTVAVWIGIDDDEPRSLGPGDLDDPTDVVLGQDADTVAPTGPSSRPSRAARSRTWPGDSSPVAYSTPTPPPGRAGESGGRLEEQRRLADPGLAAEQHERAGDEPATEDPVELVDAEAAGAAGRRRRCRPGRPAPPPPDAGPRPSRPTAPARGSRTTVSTRVFQPPQARHCPSQRRNASPQDWQTKRLWGRAIARPPVGRRGSPRLDRGARLGEVDVEARLGVLVHDDRGAGLVRCRAGGARRGRPRSCSG